MKLSQVKKHLSTIKILTFQLPNGELVPEHFHITEIGKINKHFIDCGGTVRQEEVISLQLWSADDYNHRLHPEKFAHIINIFENTLSTADLDVEVEYQGNTIEKYDLDVNGTHFILAPKQTDCLAKEQCGIPPKKQKVMLSSLNEPCCNAEGNCC